MLFAAAAQVQKPGVVRGTVVDSATAGGLNNATVTVVAAKDAALLSSTLTSGSGFFEIKNIDTGAYVLLIAYQGYINIQKAFSIAAGSAIKDFGIIKAGQQYKQLGEVVLNSSPPVQVKGDTLAYRADAFKTKPNATVEDLLKKLPGVQVERDGTVKTGGENVQKIYVDGKEFFGNDPKLATKNLTADMIEGIEVYEEGSEQSRFSGVDDGARSKTINLKLKKNKKSGVFGRVGAGYGTDRRFEVNGSASLFKGTTKLSLIGRANNTNNIGFTQSDMTGVNSSGQSNNSAASAPGITRNSNTGINYSDAWGKKVEVTGSYFFNNTQTENRGSSYRQTFFADSAVNRSQLSSTENSSTNHRFNLRLTYAIDSFNSIVFTPNISLQHSENRRRSNVESAAQNSVQNYRINDNYTSAANEGNGSSWNSNLVFRHRFAKRGRTFSVSLSNAWSSNDRNSLTNAKLGFYNRGFKYKDSLVQQTAYTNNGTGNYGIGVSYTEPVGRDKVLELNYNYNDNNSSNHRNVFDLDTITGRYDIVNVLQTNLFENGNRSSRAGANLRIVKKKYNYQVGMSVQQLLLQSNNISKASLISQTFNNLFPTASFNYKFARSKNFRFDYRGRTAQPGVTQLQPIRDVSNPLYQTEGNPALQQEYSNNLTVTYNSFNMQRLRNLFTRFSFSNTYNKIVNNITQLGKGVQLTRPVNANGAYAVNGIVDFGVPISKMKGGNVNTTTTFNLSRDVNLAEGITNYTRRLVVGENVRVNYNYKEKLDMGISGGATYNRTRYTILPRNNNAYYRYAASADISYIFPQNFVLSTDVDYTATSGLSDGFNQSFFLWNASFARQMLKNKRGELKLSVFDILKQNRSIVRNIADNYIEDVQNTVLQRFCMLSFTWNLNKGGAAASGGQPNQPRRMGR